MTNRNRFMSKLTYDPRCFVCGIEKENARHELHRRLAALAGWHKLGQNDDEDLLGELLEDWLLQILTREGPKTGEWFLPRLVQGG